jgi:CRISPR-associated exonuclease Cas4
VILELALALALLALAAGAALWWSSERQRQQLGLPRGRAVYQDRPEDASPVLRARTLPLRGRPDLLIDEGEFIIPIEVKTGRTPREPYRGHVLQLLAYCLLVEEHHGVRPPFGLIRYPGREFRIAYDTGRERELRAVVATIAREKTGASEQHRSHASPPRCAACGFRAHCEERLSG